ncbi:MAG: CIA30 family protein [Actinomycetota bacterium]
MRLLCLALVSTLLLTACGDADEDATAATSTTAAPGTAAPTTTTTPAPPTTAAPTTTMAAAAPTTTTVPAEDPSCRVLDDPVEGGPSGWVVVNDGVMGGRSEGQLAVVEDVLVFDGEIVTEGGGFSSIRTELDFGALDGVERIVVRAQTDGRSYLLTADDAAPERERRTSFEAPIPFTSEAGTQEVTVLLDDLVPVVFGQRIEDAPFDRALASEIGIQLSDGVDGPFRLELDALLACSG